MKFRYLIIISIIATVVWIIVLLPASIIVQQITSRNPKVTVSEVSGTIWDVKLKNIHIYDYEKIDTINFKFNAKQLLLANLAANIEIKRDKSWAKGYLIFSSTNSFRLNNLTASIELAPIIKEQLSNLNIVSPYAIQANLNISIKKFMFDNLAIYAEGEITLSQIEIEQQKILGEFIAKATTKNHIIHTQINSSADAEVNLESKSALDRQGKYKISTTIGINDKTSGIVRTALIFLGINLETPEQTFNSNGNLFNLKFFN